MVEAPRMDITKLAPEAYRHLIALEGTIASKIEPKLYHLIKLRASQINGCAFCIGMHTDEALRDGESLERIVLLDAWEESSLYSDKERAALEWVEDLTLIADTHAPKESFDGLKEHPGGGAFRPLRPPSASGVSGVSRVGAGDIRDQTDVPHRSI